MEPDAEDSSPVKGHSELFRSIVVDTIAFGTWTMLRPRLALGLNERRMWVKMRARKTGAWGRFAMLKDLEENCDGKSDW